MAAVNPPYAIQARADHPARLFREVLQSLRGRAGVLSATDLATSQTGTPSMGVSVTAGRAVIDGTQGGVGQGSYLVYNDAAVVLTIAAADATNPRNDLVVAQVQDAEYAGGTNAWQLVIVQGTPAPSPVDPAIPANSLALARVRVNAVASSILNANITPIANQGVLYATSGWDVAPADAIGQGAIGAALVGARADHQHPNIVIARAQQSPAVANIGAAFTNYGGNIGITPRVPSRILVWVSVCFQTPAVAGTAHLAKVQVDGNNGILNASGVEADQYLANSTLTLTFFDIFEGFTAAAHSVQVQLYCGTSQNFTTRGSGLVIEAIALPT